MFNIALSCFYDFKHLKEAFACKIHISPHKNSIKLQKYISPHFQYSAFSTLRIFNTPGLRIFMQTFLHSALSCHNEITALSENPAFLNKGHLSRTVIVRSKYVIKKSVDQNQITVRQVLATLVRSWINDFPFNPYRSNVSIV